LNPGKATRPATLPSGREHAAADGGGAWMSSRCPACLPDRFAVTSSRSRVSASAGTGGPAGLRPQPLGDLEGGTDFQAVAGQREREQPFGALEAVEDGVAVGV
jgi:hypothetical protein